MQRLTESRPDVLSEAKPTAAITLAFDAERVGSAPIVLCGRCRRALLPNRAQPTWHRDVHRAAADGMVAQDPATEKAVAKAKRRRESRERRASLRRAVRSGNLPGAAKLFLETRTAPLAERLNEDCPDCLELRERIARRMLTRRLAGAA